MARPEKRDKMDAEALRLNNMKTANPSALKAARTRFENAHRAYWTACREAWAEIEEAGGDADLEAIAETHGVQVSDILEIAGT